MSELGTAIAEVREELAGASSEFMPDLCSIVKNTATDGGASGDTLAASDGATDIPCSYRPAGQRSMVVVGGEAHLASHRLTLPVTEDTLLIKPEDRIKIAPRDDEPELIFQQPVIIEGSFTVFVNIAATLVQQGY